MSAADDYVEALIAEALPWVQSRPWVTTIGLQRKMRVGFITGGEMMHRLVERGVLLAPDDRRRYWLAKVD